MHNNNNNNNKYVCWAEQDVIDPPLGLCLRFGFDPGTDVFGFCCVIAGKINNMLLVWSGTEFSNCCFIL